MILRAAVTASIALAAGAPPSVSSFGAWSAAGNRIAFVGTIGGRSGLWTQSFGSSRATRLGPATCGKGTEQIDQLAAGPNGSWGCLERTVGNTESYYSVAVVSARGAATHVATAGGKTGKPVDSIPQLVGDGSFLGYIRVTAGGAVQLYRITPSGRGTRVANLAGAPLPTATAVSRGTIALLGTNGSVAVYTTAGRRLATIKAKAASLAVTATRVLVRTRDRRLVVYGLRGGLVHSWRLGAKTWTAGLATDGRYAAYLGANKAVRVMRLSNGVDRVLARAGSGWFFNGVSLDVPGAAAPLTAQRGKAFTVTWRYVPRSALRKTLG